MFTKRILTVIAATAGAVALLSSPASAINWEYDNATGLNSSSDGPFTWLHTDDVSGAFAPDGDWFFLADNRADGHGTLVDWRLKNSSGTLVRGGQIKMTLGAGEIRYQNKDFAEGYKLTWRVCREKGTGLDHCSGWKTQTA